MQCICGKCQHEWFARKKGIPRRCPECHSELWNGLREAKTKKYDFASLEVGQSKVIPWPEKTEHGAKIQFALNMFSYRTKRKFYRQGTNNGLFVQRIK